MSAYKIEVSFTPLCPSCGKECHPGSFMTESKPPHGIFDRDNPYERTDRRVFVAPCTDCFVFRGDVESVIEAAEVYAEAEAAMANREINGINAESIDRLQSRVHAARHDLESVLARVKGGAA